MQPKKDNWFEVWYRMQGARWVKADSLSSLDAAESYIKKRQALTGLDYMIKTCAYQETLSKVYEV